jgi:putative transposase
MSRKTRTLVDNGVYHITSRGHNRYRLFHDTKDYEKYKDVISKYKKKYIFDLFHYCLMPNHIHLLLRIAKGEDLPHLLQCLNQAYAKHYKRSYKMIGNLFQGRYKDVLVDTDSYLLECGRYIERNPYRAGLVKDPSSYQWSSCGFYAKGKPDDIITLNPLYVELGATDSERLKKYKDYLLQNRPYEYMVDKALKV